MTGESKQETNAFDDPFGENNFNFKKSKSDKKMENSQKKEDDVFNQFPEKKRESEMFDQPNGDNILSGKRESNNKQEDDFDFEDNFGDFGNKKKKENMDFKFGEQDFEDPFAEKPNQPKENYDFDFENNKQGENEQKDDVFEEPKIRIERPSENLDFDDPFGNEERDSGKGGPGTERESQRTENNFDQSDIDAMNDPFTQNSSAKRKK